MTVTREYLTDYLKGIDSRLAAMPDEKLWDKIRYGIQNLASQATCFVMEEFIPLKDYIENGFSKFSVSPTKEIINYYNIEVSSISDDMVLDAYVYSTAIRLIQSNDMKIYVDIINPAIASDFALKIKYFYSPDILLETTLEVQPEVWHFMKHSIQIVAWGALKDYEKEQYHQKVLDAHLSQKTLTMPIDMPDGLRGGFI